MGTTFVVPGDPSADRGPGLGVVGEVVLTDALLLEAAEETLDHAVLRRRVRRDELLPWAVVTAGGADAQRREGDAVVEYAPMDQRLRRREAQPMLSVVCFRSVGNHRGGRPMK